MAGFFQKLKGTSAATSKGDSNAAPKTKKDEPAQELTPVEKLLHNAGPLREDGSDKLFGLENFGNTCYCNSIVQALYHTETFRENVVRYPLPSPHDPTNGTPQAKVNVTIRPPPANANGTATAKGQKPGAGQAAKPRQTLGNGQLPPGVTPVRPEDRPDAPEYKKKQAILKGPVLELAEERKDAYGMEECTFTALKDIFNALIDSESRTGVLSPQRFLDIFKRDNEMFRNSMHQDAHEFYGIVLNDVIANVEANAKRMLELESAKKNGTVQPTDLVTSKNGAVSATRLPGTAGTGWVHDIFEGVLTSETRCLTCETASQRDETFLDLSIDLEEHSSVTSCLRKFSAEEMLCERNKFHCDHCGGLQEAEKRMKIKKLPKVLALHLKRFKYTEDYSRLQKLFHRVVYPYHLRMFNTTDDAEDPDRLYELYAVVVHIGGNAYHGHYVSVIKTKDRGWLLFDDEMVEPVDRSFVRNFFGDKPGMACAYVLFYQETTFEKVREEMDAEGLEQVKEASEVATLSTAPEHLNGATSPLLTKLNTNPLPPVDELEALDQVKTARSELASPTQLASPAAAQAETHPLVAAPPPAPAVMTKSDEAATVPPKTKEEKQREKKEQKAAEKAAEKARKAAEKAQKNEEEQLQKTLKESERLAAEEEKKRKKAAASAENGDAVGEASSAPVKNGTSLLNRASRGSKSMTRKSFAFLGGKDKDRDKEKEKGGDKTGDHRSDKSDSKSDRAESSTTAATTTTTTTTATSATTVTSGAEPLLNGSGRTSHSPARLPERAGTAPPETNGKEKQALIDRLGFGLGRKKSSKFLH